MIHETNISGFVSIPIMVTINLRTAKLRLAMFMTTGEIYNFNGDDYECLGIL